MIISASRRTDIPRFYSEWLFNRIAEGFVDVRNPLFPNQVSRYSLNSDIVDGIVFWTKDPEPMLARLDELADYRYYFHFSLTPYGKDVERGLRDKHSLIATFQKLSEMIGPERLVWRYDPILINEKYSIEYHRRAFNAIASELKGHTNKVIISFIDEYTFATRSVFESTNTEGVSPSQQSQMAEFISEIARANGMDVATCAEAIDLSRYGIEHARCVDVRIFERLNGCRLSRLKGRYKELQKDRAQRKLCRCVESIDIGCANSCSNGCAYCYATTSQAMLMANLSAYDPHSTMLCGRYDPSKDRLKDNRGTGSSRDRSFKYGEGGKRLFRDA